MIFLFEKGKDTVTLLKCIVGIKACKNGLRNMIWKKIWTVNTVLYPIFSPLQGSSIRHISPHIFSPFFLSFFLFFQTVSTTSVIIPALISNLFEALLLAAQHIKFDANLVRRRCVLHQMIDAFFQREKKFAATREHGQKNSITTDENRKFSK